MTIVKLEEEWSVGYLFVSFAMAFIGSYSAVTLAELYRVVCRVHPKFIRSELTLLLMAIAIGMGAIWSMHFVGMGALTLRLDGKELQTEYDVGVTVLSMFAAIICVYIGLYISSRDQMFTMSKQEVFTMILEEAKTFKSLRDTFVLLKFVLLRNPLPLICGGLIMGSGVVVMHYIGMVAMKSEAKVHWDVGILITSIIIALVASCAAYWILFRLLALFPSMEIIRLGSAIVMTIAVCSVHYTGMAAASYTYDTNNPFPSSSSHHISPTISKTLALQVAIMLSLIFNYSITMIVEAELRSCYYRLLNLDCILKTTMEDPRMKHENVGKEYHNWEKSYWKPTQIRRNFYPVNMERVHPYQDIDKNLDKDGINHVEDDNDITSNIVSPYLTPRDSISYSIPL